MSCCCKSRDRGPGTGDPLKAVPPTIVLVVGWVDPGCCPGEAQRMRRMMLGFTRMKPGFNPTCVSLFDGSPVPGSRFMQEASS
jgi:hypothetical protein